MKSKFALVLVSGALLPNNLTLAEYPGVPLQWDDCSDNTTFCGKLEFCHEGGSYGYRHFGQGAPCGAFPGPLIRMNQGNKYKLTFVNSASSVDTVTNVHTHGLHIVGAGDGDDVTRFVEGGSCLDYTWDIPADHPPGTNWYHSHLHEETNEQVDGGAFGMLIIEDDPSTIYPWAWPDNEILLLISNTDKVRGNGNLNEVIDIAGDHWYRLRVSAVVPGGRASDLSFDGGNCQVYKVASDGVWHSASFNTFSGSTFELTGSSRADFAIKCVSSVNIKWGKKVAATLNVVGSDPNGDYLGMAPAKPLSLQGIAGANVADENKFPISMSAAKINGQSWDPDVGLGTIAWNIVHEWDISGSGAHPFHLHLYHMLIVTPGGCGAHQEGEFYDTISAQGSCKVRFKTADIGQRMVMVSQSESLLIALVKSAFLI